MLRDWLPFLIYGFMALAIPVSMIAMSFAFAQRPTRRIRARTLYGLYRSAEAPMTPEEIAREYDLPVEAVKEAIATVITGTSSHIHTNM